MAGTLIVSNLKTDTDNTFIVRSNTGTTLFSANTSGIDIANSIGATAITNDKILSVANTKISGNIISSQITSVANTQLTGLIQAAQIGSANATLITSGTLPGARLPTGSVLQVAQGFKTDTFSTASTSLQDVSGLSVTLTPISSSSKFLIMLNMTYVYTLFVGRVVLLRNSTEIGKADAAGSRPLDFLYYSNSTNASTDGQWVRDSMNYLDSPATSSSITYKIQVSARTDSAGGTFYINRSYSDRNTTSYDARGVSSIVVMEIAG